jgi:translation initiation factor 4B
VSVSGDSKPNPFGGAAPVDTVAREREIEEKRLAAIQEKKEAEEKAKADAREAAKAAEAEKVEKDKKVEILKKNEGEDASKDGETIEREDAQGEVVDDKAVKPKEIVRDAKPRPSDSGAWRRPSAGPPGPRDDNIPRGPRGGRGGRGGGRGPRGYHDEGRGGRQNSNGARPSPSPATAPQTPTTGPEAAVLEEDGWSTVSKPKKNNRGGNQGSRAIAS